MCMLSVCVKRIRFDWPTQRLHGLNKLTENAIAKNRTQLNGAIGMFIYSFPGVVLTCYIYKKMRKKDILFILSLANEVMLTFFKHHFIKTVYN